MNFYHVALTLIFIILVALLFWVINGGAIRRVIGGKRTGVTVTITTDGAPAELEQSVKGLIGLIDNRTLDPKTVIVIKNAAVNPETAQMARILARDYSAVRLES